MRKDLKEVGLEEDEWYREATRLRAGWRAMYRDGLELNRESRIVEASVAVRDVMYEVCAKKFRRETDKK